MIHKPEMTMFYAVKAGMLHCNNSDGCIFCEYHCFCEKVVSAIECLQTKFPKDYERIYELIKDDSDKLSLYTARCTNCGMVSPVGNYCIWCGEKDTCLEGDTE